MYCEGIVADIYSTWWVLWQLSGYARGWSSLSNCDWLPSSETVNLMLQYKYSLMFSFGLCSYADTSTSPLIAQLHPAWPTTSHPRPKLSLACSPVCSPSSSSRLHSTLPPHSTVPMSMGLEISQASLNLLPPHPAFLRPTWVSGACQNQWKQL